ncbi:MAG: hypothetical protein Fur009_4220 [Candidatus Microgenomates bacterium]
MVTEQLLLIIIITTSTFLMIVVGIQLIFILKEIRLMIKKISYSIDDVKLSENETHKKEINHKHLKKYSTINTILNKISLFSPKLAQKSKKLFVKESKNI